MKRPVLAILGLAVILGVAFWLLSPRLFNRPKPQDSQVTLNFWGLWEDEGVFKPVIDAYQGAHPNVKIIYSKQSLTNYRTRLQTQLQAGQGPDIFPIHNSWLPMFSSDLSPSPESTITLNDFQKLFYPVAKADLTQQKSIYALPLSMDGLVLYINTDILKAADVNPPTTWQDFVSSSQKMTVRDQSGQIQTSGAAMGATNVDFWPEIMGLLFYQQPNGDLSNPGNRDGVEVMQFFTSFITDPKTKTWDTTLPNSTQMFTQGKLAYYFAPVSRAVDIKLANTNLNFKMIQVPQLPGKNVAWASFWPMAVSVRSTHSKEAWDFLRFLVAPKALQATFQTRQKLQGLGEPYPRVDMAEQISQDSILGAVVAQGPSYKSWYLNSDTGDAGINDEMVALYQQALTSVLQGGDPQAALAAIQPKIQAVLEKYKPASK